LIQNREHHQLNNCSIFLFSTSFLKDGYVLLLYCHLQHLFLTLRIYCLVANWIMFCIWSTTCWIVTWARNILNKSCREKWNKYFMPHTLFAISQDKYKTANVPEWLCEAYIAKVLFHSSCWWNSQNVISMTNFITEYCMKRHFLNVYVPLL
jgi:hypothetical protein